MSVNDILRARRNPAPDRTPAVAAGVIRAIASLAGRRLAGRAGATLLLVAAVAAATGLTGTIRAIGLSATDAAVGTALARLDPADRTLRISGYAPSSSTAVELDAAAASGATTVGAFTEPAAAGVILRRVRDPGVPYDLQVVGVDDPGRWLGLAEGRLPAACGGASCEAVLLAVGAAPDDLPAVVHVAGLEVRIVGRATMTSPIPLGHLDERGPERPPDDPTAQLPSPAPALLLVDGVATVASAQGTATIGRTYLWTAPLRAATVHPWTIARLEAALSDARRSLAIEAPALTLAAPTEAIRVELARGAVNDGRLVIVGSLGVAILVAFAGYAALIGRRDLRAELERLAAAGASRRARALLVALEVVVPTGLGTIAGWAGAVLVAGVVATGAGTDPGGVVRHALSDAASLALAAAVLAGSIVAILAGLLGIARREAVVGLLPGGLAVVAFVGWRLLAAGGLDAGALGSAVELPVLALIPAIVGVAVAAVSLVVVPVVLRRLARAGRTVAMPVRLALLSHARDPVRPAATITLLAFGIGGLAFGIVDASTLRRGIADQAAFAVGMDLQVTEAPSALTLSATVAPFERYASLGAGVEAFPVAHVGAGAGPAGEVAVLGLPPAALERLRGWRDDLGADPATLAAAIEVDGSFAVPGVPLGPDAPTIVVTVTHAGDPVHLSAVVGTDDGDAVRIFLGTLTPGLERLEAPLPAAAIGGRIIGLIVSESRLVAGSEHLGVLARATLAFEGLELITGPDPVAVEVSGVRTAVLRAPLPTDDLVLPAIVGPAVATAAGSAPDGVLALTLGDRPLIRIRVAGVLPRLPGAPESEAAFAVVDLDPLLAAMDGAAPGAGRADQAWIRVDDPARLAEVRAALAGAPFRETAIRSRDVLEASAAADPYASSTLAAFAAAAIAGLLLAALGLALGALADLRDESGELRDLEAQGLGPRALRRQVATRTLVLAAAGALSGIAMGLGLAWLVTTAVGVGADLARPVPPLRLEVPWAELVAAAALPILAAAVLAWGAARRSFRAPARTRDRA